jgi:hypothetical protein
MPAPASLLSFDPLARRVGLVLGAVTVLVVGVFVAVVGLNKLTPVVTWRPLVDVGVEANIPTWWNVALLVLLATSAGAAAEISRAVDPRIRLAWWVVSGAATYLSIDEASSLHERLAGPVNDLGVDLPTFAWVLPGFFVAAGGAIVLVIAGRRLPHPTGFRLGVALACYGGAAVGIEAFNGWIRVRRYDSDVSDVYTFGTVVEESVEMGACAYAVATIVDAFRVRRTPTGIVVEPR